MQEQATSRGPSPRYTFTPIGYFQSPLTPETGAPRQGRLAPENKARIAVAEAYEECLEGLEDCSHLVVLFVFSRSRDWEPIVTPGGGGRPRGLFATRSPRRPCPIGMTTVKLEGREGRVLHVSGVDAFDRTPVLDIKPYVKSIDCIPEAKDPYSP